MNKWQTWIQDTLADITADSKCYLEDTCDDIISQGMATTQEINDYLVSIDQEPMYAS